MIEVYVIFCPVASLLYNPLPLQTHDAIGVSRLRQLPEINVIAAYRLLTRKPIPTGFVHVCPTGVDGISRSTARLSCARIRDNFKSISLDAFVMHKGGGAIIYGVGCGSGNI